MIGAALLLVAIVLMLALNEQSQEDIQRACGSAGVRQVVPTAWEAIDGTVTVVCLDGRVVKVD